MVTSTLPHISTVLVAAFAALAAYRSCEAIQSPGVDVRDVECSLDEECTLVPSQLTCCGECEPAPPFEAIPRARLDALLIELDADCAPRSRLCDPPVCTPVPFDCEARPSCIAGVCRAIATPGCSVRLAADPM